MNRPLTDQEKKVLGLDKLELLVNDTTKCLDNYYLSITRAFVKATPLGEPRLAVIRWVQGTSKGTGKPKDQPWVFNDASFLGRNMQHVSPSAFYILGECEFFEEANQPRRYFVYPVQFYADTTDRS